MPALEWDKMSDAARKRRETFKMSDDAPEFDDEQAIAFMQSQKEAFAELARQQVADYRAWRKS